MVFSKALPHEVPAIIKKCRADKACDAQWWSAHLPAVAAFAPEMVPPDIAHTLWAIAKVPAKPAVARLFTAFEPTICADIKSYTPRELATVAGAYAQALVPSSKLFPVLATSVANYLKRHNDKGSSSTSRSRSGLNYDEDKPMRKTGNMTTTTENVSVEGVDCEPTDYVKLLHAFAKVRHRSECGIISLATEELVPWISHLYPRDVATVIWALGHLGANASQSAPFINEAIAMGHARRLNAVDVCNVAYGMGKMKAEAKDLKALGDIACKEAGHKESHDNALSSSDSDTTTTTPTTRSNHKILLHSMGANNIATLTWALGKSRALPGELEHHIQVHMMCPTAQYSILDVMFILQGLQASGGGDSKTWSVVLEHVQRLAPKMRQMDAIHIIPALAKCPDSSLCYPVVTALDPLLHTLKPRDGIFVLQALDVLKTKPACWDSIEASLLKSFPEKIPIAQWILCLSTLDEGSDLRRAIIEELEKDLLWTGEFRNIVSILLIEHISNLDVWKTAAEAFRLQAPKLPLSYHMLQVCVSLVKRNYYASEIIGLVMERLPRISDPLGVAELEMVGQLLEQVEVFDLNAWNAAVRSWEKLDPRPSEFLASCAKVQFRPDITLDWVKPSLSFDERCHLLQVLVKLDYASQIPWSYWLPSTNDISLTENAASLKTFAFFLHATCFFTHMPWSREVMKVFSSLPLKEWDLYSAAQVLTALIHWQPHFHSRTLGELRNIVAILDFAEKGASKRQRYDDGRRREGTWETQRAHFSHTVFDALTAAPIRQVFSEVQAGPYGIDIVVYLKKKVKNG